MPSFTANPATDKTNSETFILLNFAKRLVLIGGTNYAGEIKKSIFTVMNYLLPLRDVMPMHCSANIGAGGDVALFFGLSGTGKTTLSSDPHRQLIGDDEHGWSADGVFNFEGGCYAKMIRLSAEAEPQIYATTQRFGTVLENVTFDPRHARARSGRRHGDREHARRLSARRSSTTRCRRASGGHPTNVVMLTADAFGVLPPIARLSPAAAMYHFLSGYTAKVAGTERGVTEPKATFSTCFGAPFMVWDPNVYAKLLGERIAKHNVARLAGQHRLDGRPVRRRLAHEDRAHARDDQRRALRRARPRAGTSAIRSSTSTCRRPARACRPTSSIRATPGRTRRAYDAQAKKLATMFAENFKTFEATATAGVKAAGPKASRSASHRAIGHEARIGNRDGSARGSRPGLRLPIPCPIRASMSIRSICRRSNPSSASRSTRSC